MKKRFWAVVLLIATVGVGPAFAAETSVKGTVYADWMLNSTSGANNYNAFTIDRAYFGAESKLSDYTNLRIVFDIRPERFSTSATRLFDSEGDTVNVPSLSAYSGYPVVLKYAYADVKIKPWAKILKARIGMQPTMYLYYVEGYWNRRYIEKSANDLNGWTSTSDLGLTALANLDKQGNLGEVGASVLNGTKYNDFVDKNNNKDLNFFGKLTPFYNDSNFSQVALFGQFYTGVQNVTLAANESGSDWKRQIASVGGKLAYQKKVDFCADLDFQTLGQGLGNADRKQRALSLFGSIYLNELAPSSSLLKTLNLYGRFDSYDPNTKVADDGYSLVVAGLECAPVKGFRASLAYKQKSPQATGALDEKYVMVNTEFKF